jgi:outer membrane protein
MKKLFKVLGVIVLLVSFSVNTNAQSRAKFGYIDSEKLLSMMPERAKAQKELQDFAKSLEDQLASMNSELQQKYNEYMQKKDSLPDFLRQTKEKEINVNSFVKIV